MIRMIAALSSNSVIGVKNSLPFNYPEDLKNFKKMTLNSTVIMGRNTYSSINKPLPKRRNIVISKIAKGLGILKPNGIEISSSLEDALNLCKDDESIWLIGGASVYELGMNYAKEILLTITPDYISERDCVKFPWINPTLFDISSKEIMKEDPRLTLVKYTRI